MMGKVDVGRPKLPKSLNDEIHASSVELRELNMYQLSGIDCIFYSCIKG